jgi:hypothetical protein
LQSNQNAAILCEDWWDLTEPSSASGAINMHVTQVIALQIIKDVHLRQALLRAQKFETLAVGGLIQFFHLLAHSSADIDSATKASINSSLKNLMFFTHQNLLIVVQILLNRMILPPSSAQVT